MKLATVPKLIWLVFILLVAACAAQPSPQPLSATSSSGDDRAEATSAPVAGATDVVTVLEADDQATQRMVDALSATGLPAAWMPQGDLELYDVENLYDLVNGQADEYFAYAFEQAAVRTFENASGDTLRVEMWRTATAADAYGLYSGYRAGMPVGIGNEGDGDPGRRLGFWQDRYNVRLFAFQPVPDDELVAFAELYASVLPAGGDQPAVMGQLPQNGLDERSILFFHKEISIQNDLWLGGENLLGLGPETDGVLARYDVDGGLLQLILVRYPNAGASQAGLEALESVPPDNLLAAEVRGDLFGAVFGMVDRTAAKELLAAALGN
jgi:hypothetical protein